jgi:uncharacterized membrane protein YdjX (TVP38/TMEM64 family)
MKNMFSHDDDLSLDSLWKKPTPSKLDLAQTESLVDRAMNLFSKKDTDSGIKESDYMQQQGYNMTTVLALGSALILSIAVGTTGVDIPSLSQLITGAEHLFQDPNGFLQDVIQNVESMGPDGALYFGLFYTIAEILCVPALPLTASAGYLFGLAKGTAVVLTAASVAAAISFLIGRTFLRDLVEEKLEDYPEFQKIDSAIGKEGFKLMVLLRLSPIFPFSLSNYLYGASSVGFWQYFFGTMIGFAPGTIAYVYSGDIGKALTGGGDAKPWYIYAGGLLFVAGLLKLVADVATTTIREMEEEAP